MVRIDQGRLEEAAIRRTNISPPAVRALRAIVATAGQCTTTCTSRTMRTAEPVPADRVSFRPASAAAAVDSLQGLQRQTILEDSRPHSAHRKSLRTPPAMSSTTDSEQENLETTAAAPAEPFDWQPCLWGGLLALLVVLVYLADLGNAYIWDDDSYVSEQPCARLPEGLYNMWFKRGPFSRLPARAHDAAVRHQLWGFDPHGYHLVNMLLHATGVILLWRVLLRLNVPARGWPRRFLRCIRCASKAWPGVSELKTSSRCALVLASILVYLRDAPLDEPADAKRPQEGWDHELALGLFVAALLKQDGHGRSARRAVGDLLVEALPRFFRGNQRWNCCRCSFSRRWPASPSGWKRRSSERPAPSGPFARRAIFDRRPGAMVLCGKAGLAAPAHVFLSPVCDRCARVVAISVSAGRAVGLGGLAGLPAWSTAAVLWRQRRFSSSAWGRAWASSMSFRSAIRWWPITFNIRPRSRF